MPGAENYREPTLVTELESLEIITLACGGNHTLFLTKGNTRIINVDTEDSSNELVRVYATGDGSSGQLGLGLRDPTAVTSPKPIEFFNSYPIVDICAGENHSMAMSENGLVYVFGCNNFGQVSIISFLHSNKESLGWDI